MGEFEIQKQIWEREVNDVAAELVRNGTPPYDAMVQAQQIVSNRRKAKWRDILDMKEVKS